AHGRDRGGDVDPLHDLAAEHGAERVGVAGQNERRGLDAGGARRLAARRLAHGLSRNRTALSSLRRPRSSPVSPGCLAARATYSAASWSNSARDSLGWPGGAK